MNKSTSLLLVLGFFVYACSQAPADEKKVGEEKQEKKTEKKEPRKLEMVKTSELATLMRLMDAELQSAKISIEGGFSFHDSLTFNYGNLHSAAATEASMKKAGFDGFANSFLKQLENLKNSSQPKQKEQYNLLINSCLSCHAQHCPGPVAKIKELRIGK